MEMVPHLAISSFFFLLTALLDIVVNIWSEINRESMTFYKPEIDWTQLKLTICDKTRQIIVNRLIFSNNNWLMSRLTMSVTAFYLYIILKVWKKMICDVFIQSNLSIYNFASIFQLTQLEMTFWFIYSIKADSIIKWPQIDQIYPIIRMPLV